MQKARNTLQKQRPLVLSRFRTERAYSSGAVEGISNKAKLSHRKAYGIQFYKAFELAACRILGNLPEHHLAERFC